VGWIEVSRVTFEELVKMDGAVQRLLEDWSQGATPPLSLESLLGHWRRLVDRVVGGYELSLDDYFNDVDARIMLEEVLRASDAELRNELGTSLRSLDERFVTATEIADFLPRTDPWSVRIPKKMGHEMRAQLQDLERARRFREQ
jgi:hypothetical protein